MLFFIQENKGKNQSIYIHNLLPFIEMWEHGSIYQHV